MKSSYARIALVAVILLIVPMVVKAVNEPPRETMTIPYITETEGEPVLHTYHESAGIVHVTIIPYPVSRTDLITTAEILWVEASVLHHENIHSALKTRYREGKKSVIVGYGGSTPSLAEHFGLLEKKSDHVIVGDSRLAGYLVQQVGHHEVVHSIQYHFAADPDARPIDPLAGVSRKDFSELFGL